MSKIQARQITDGKQHVKTLMQQGQLKRATMRCEALCRDDSLDAELHYLLGSLYGHQGRYREAVASLRESLKLQPSVFAVHCSLGVALSLLGDYAAAEPVFRNALELQPDSPDALLYLAQALSRQGKSTEAVECLQQVLRVRSSSIEALRGLGEIRHSDGRLQEAADYYARALTIEPRHADTNNRLGRCLLELGRLNASLPYFEKAVAIDPRFIIAYTNMGSAHLMLGNLNKARTAFRGALELNPDNLIACLGEIRVYEYEGDYQGAWGCLSRLIRRGIEDPDIAVSFVRLCHRFDRCADAVEYAERILTTQELVPKTESHLRYSLGSLFDRLGEFEKAFSQFHRANTLRSDNFSTVEHIGTVDAIIRVFNWQFFTTAPRATVRSGRPIFIVGMPRSGTSLTEQILASHPEVHGAGELRVMDHIVSDIPILLHRNIGYPFNVTRLSTAMLDNLANRYLDHIEKLAPDAGRVTDKMPQNFIHLGLIALLFPDARIVHCKRDPRDTCLSVYFQDFSEAHTYASKLEHIGLYYCQYEKLIQHFRGLLDIPILEIQYEELVTNQEEMSRKLIDFAGLEWDDRCLAFDKTARFVPTASYDQVRQKMYTGSVGRWKHYEKHLGPLLESLGLA